MAKDRVFALMFVLWILCECSTCSKILDLVKSLFARSSCFAFWLPLGVFFAKILQLPWKFDDIFSDLYLLTFSHDDIEMTFYKIDENPFLENAAI
jgi:hypothetical protein